LFRSATQGPKTQGGISYVLVPENNTSTNLRRIQDYDELTHTLLKRNITHFAQAHGTPFTVSPLVDLLGYDGCNTVALNILDGQIPQSIPNYAQKLLKQIVRRREPIKLNMTLDDMCNGFRKWREQTTTSPSKKHLGIYKALVNSRTYTIYTTQEEAQQEHDNTISHQCLLIQFLLMTLAVEKCHTFERWNIVHNFLIEKFQVHLSLRNCESSICMKQTGV
jgi:hypothetical protein